MNIEVFTLHSGVNMPLVPADRERDWMNALPERYANRCLPLRVANEAGWWVLNERPFWVMWDGGQHQSSVKVEYLDTDTPESVRVASSHFGGGILTIFIPFLFRTPPGYNLLIRGPANFARPGASALEGIVETDWAPYSATMNWQITEVNKTVLFGEDEPICMVVPQKRGELEEFYPVIGSEDDPIMHANRAWTLGRHEFLQQILDDQVSYKTDWQRDYFQGRLQMGANDRFEEHQTKLALRSLGDRVDDDD